MARDRKSEIDFWKRFAYSLAFLPYGPVGRGFGLGTSEPIDLSQLLRHTIDENRYPLSPQLAPLKGDLGEAGTAEALARASATAESLYGALAKGKGAGNADECVSRAADDARQRRGS